MYIHDTAYIAQRIVDSEAQGTPAQSIYFDDDDIAAIA